MYRSLYMMAVLCCAMVLLGCAYKASVPPVAQQPVIQVQDSATARPVQLQRIKFKIDRGAPIGRTCHSSMPIYYEGGSFDVDNERFMDVFREELERANYRVVGASDDLFDDATDPAAEYLVAGVITSLQADVCYPNIGIDDFVTAIGAAYIQVGWQVYSRLDRKVVFERSTEGRGEIIEARPGGDTEIVYQAFGQAVRNLLAERGLHDLLAGAGGAPAERVALTATFAPRRPFAEPIAGSMTVIRNNVVVVYAGGGHGSGFVIDDEGHLITNEHVVRTAERVRVRFEAGEEVTAAVLATDVRRDVALLKIERGGTGGLPIRFELPAVGDEVYAVGAPLDPSYSATVSKGIVSSLRTFDGELWIQSDVNVQPGNSGGPLLDDRGNIVGITSRGAPTDAGTPSGVNFFVPITDALDRLGLSPRAAAS